MDASRNVRERELPRTRTGNEIAGSGDRVFLSAAWRNLVILNYEVDPGILAPHVPAGVEIDSFDRKAYVSLVGFQFLRTRLFGSLRIPGHANFDEINLRFYVCRRVGDEIRRGVVFIKEIVPRRAIALAARWVYGENYSCRPMRHLIQSDESGVRAEYQFKTDGNWHRLHAQASGAAALPAENSLAEFITEHYWGYTRRGPRSFEYHVAHPRWQVRNAAEFGFDGDARELYGSAFAGVLRRPPVSTFIAEGSDVEVFRGRAIG
ncbi:MAG: YqjF family protein [Candidatus Acidiferrales bacterium]